MPKTTIEWVRNGDGSQGYSWNPIRGVKGKWHCTKVSPGCANCYAERLNLRFAGLPYTVSADTLRLDEKAMNEPMKWRNDSLPVFVCSMTDLFHEDVHFVWLIRIWQMMERNPGRVFQVLTKRPEIARERIPALRGAVSTWPLPNVWLGVSVENQEMADQRIPILLDIPAAVRWLSVEPMLGPVDLWAVPLQADVIAGHRPMLIDWVVCGGESGPGRRPFNPDWARDLLKQCSADCVAFFMKQIDKRQSIPEDLMVREWPVWYNQPEVHT